MTEVPEGTTTPLSEQARMLGKTGNCAHTILSSWGCIEMVVDIAVREDCCSILERINLGDGVYG